MLLFIHPWWLLDDLGGCNWYSALTYDLILMIARVVSGIVAEGVIEEFEAACLYIHPAKTNSTK